MSKVSKVLIVDDDKIACETLESLLKSDYYEIYITHSGKEAIDLSLIIKPDLILLDVMMPVMDGFETCQRIRENPDLSDIPIIMVTALDDRESKLRGIEVGADDYVSKPYDRLELRLRIKTITKLNRFRSIREEKDRIERLLQISPQGILILNQTGMVEHYNDKFRQLLGISSESLLLGKLFESFLPPEKRMLWKEKQAEIKQNQETTATFNTALLHASGFFLPVEIILGYFPNEDETSYQLNIRDLSYEKKIETDLSILMKAVHQSKIMLMIMDLDWKITFCNLTCYQSNGYSDKEMIEKPFVTFYPLELNQLLHNQMRELRKNKKEWKGLLSCVMKNGEILKENATISPLTDIAGFVTHFIKISEVEKDNL